MTGTQSSKHFVAKCWFPRKPERPMGEAELSPAPYVIPFRCALDGSGDRTASLKQVGLRSRSDTPR